MKLIQLLEEKLSKDAIEKWAETADVKKYHINDDLTVDIDQSLSLDATFMKNPYGDVIPPKLSKCKEILVSHAAITDYSWLPPVVNGSLTIIIPGLTKNLNFNGSCRAVEGNFHLEVMSSKSKTVYAYMLESFKGFPKEVEYYCNICGFEIKSFVGFPEVGNDIKFKDCILNEGAAQMPVSSVKNNKIKLINCYYLDKNSRYHYLVPNKGRIGAAVVRDIERMFNRKYDEMEFSNV